MVTPPVPVPTWHFFCVAVVLQFFGLMASEVTYVDTFYKLVYHIYSVCLFAAVYDGVPVSGWVFPVCLVLGTKWWVILLQDDLDIKRFSLLTAGKLWHLALRKIWRTSIQREGFYVLFFCSSWWLTYYSWTNEALGDTSADFLCLITVLSISLESLLNIVIV